MLKLIVYGEVDTPCLVCSFSHATSNVRAKYIHSSSGGIPDVKLLTFVSKKKGSATKTERSKEEE